MALNRSLTIIGILLTINQALSALDPTVLPVRYGQSGGAVAVGAQNTLVAWTDYRRTQDMVHEIFGTRVGPDGEVLDGDGIPLTGLATGGPAVAALGNMFLIVWTKGPTVCARRMTSAGQLLDARPIIVTPGNSNHPLKENVFLHFTAASDGRNFWVAWIDYRAVPAGTPEYQVYAHQDVYAARISAAGQVLDRQGIRICVRPGMQEGPQLSPRADLITWVDHRLTGKPAIFGARLDGRGLCLDPNGFEIARSTSYFSFPDVSASRYGWLVTWGEPNAIRAVHVSRQKTKTAPFTVASTTERAWPRVESAGLNYLVVWQSGANTVGARVTGKQVGQPVTLAGNDASTFSVSDVAMLGGRYCVIGTTVPGGASWMSNDVWFAPFMGSLIP